jgi:hypothetical protein
MFQKTGQHYRGCNCFDLILNTYWNSTAMTRIIKPNFKYGALTIFLFSLVSGQVLGQPFKMHENWYLGSQLSIVSFFGDLSVHDFNPARKLTEDSDFAWGLMAGKSINRLIDTRIYYNYGHMRGSNQDLDMYFSNDFNEFSIGATFNLSHWIRPQKNSVFDLKASTGVGVIYYRSIKYRMSDGSYLSSEGYTPDKSPSGKSSSALVIPVGLELNYMPGKNWMFFLGFSFRLHNQDLLDSHVGSTGISDRYSLVSAGCIYIFNSVKAKPRQKISGVPESF